MRWVCLRKGLLKAKLQLSIPFSCNALSPFIVHYRGSELPRPTSPIYPDLAVYLS